jgi:SAM-dependent methyltransferase
MAFDEFFDRRSRRFSRLYKSRAVTRALGRGALFQRLDFAIDRAVHVNAKRVLDVGCGSGVTFLPLTARGIRVTGIDPAPEMVKLAREEASRCHGEAEVVQLGWEQIPEWHTGELFDVAIALGVFDYVPNADELLRALAQAAHYVIASFPSPGMRTNLRKVRYGTRGVSVYGRSRGQIESLVRDAGLEVSELLPLGRAGFVVLGGPSEPGPGRIELSDRLRGDSTSSR